MPGIIVRNLPVSLHERIKLEAQKHHRSMAKEIVTILEERLGESAGTAPLAVKMAVPLTDEFLNKAKRWGRA